MNAREACEVSERYQGIDSSSAQAALQRVRESILLACKDGKYVSTTRSFFLNPDATAAVAELLTAEGFQCTPLEEAMDCSYGACAMTPGLRVEWGHNE